MHGHGLPLEEEEEEDQIEVFWGVRKELSLPEETANVRPGSAAFLIFLCLN